MIISLIGFMGCGKSSVGRRLSELLCCRFMDLDEVVEGVAGKSVGEIFAEDGEGAFRDLELLTLSKILSEEWRRGKEIPMPSVCASFRNETSNLKSHETTHQHPKIDSAEGTEMVLTLGGGTVMTPECAEMVKENTLCIYLRASVSTLVERLASETESRPLLCQNTSSSMPAEGAKLSDHQLRNRIEVLLAQRAATYENTASIIIDTDGKSIDQICTEILKLSPTN